MILEDLPPHTSLLTSRNYKRPPYLFHPFALISVEFHALKYC